MKTSLPFGVVAAAMVGGAPADAATGTPAPTATPQNNGTGYAVGTPVRPREFGVVGRLSFR